MGFAQFALQSASGVCGRRRKSCSSRIEHTLLFSTPARIVGRQRIGSQSNIYIWIHVTYVFQEWVVVHSCEAHVLHAMMWTVSLQTKVTGSTFGGFCMENVLLADWTYILAWNWDVFCPGSYFLKVPQFQTRWKSRQSRCTPALEQHFLFWNMRPLGKTWFFFW